METSILTSTKKLLGIDETFDAFDLDVMTFINAAFATLTQIGVGPVDGFMIESVDEEWADFVTDIQQLNQVRNYVFLKVRVLFDPPSTGYLVDSMQKQINEAEWRLNGLADFPEVEPV